VFKRGAAPLFLNGRAGRDTDRYNVCGPRVHEFMAGWVGLPHLTPRFIRCAQNDNGGEGGQGEVSVKFPFKRGIGAKGLKSHLFYTLAGFILDSKMLQFMS
jgi:hypothetical protein